MGSNMKDLVISEELVSDVLGKDIEGVHDRIVKGEIQYSVYTNDKDEIDIESINLYEFTHKNCKEWALNQKNKDLFFIAQQLSVNTESQMGGIKYHWCVFLNQNSRVSPEFRGDCENEAVIKACEWIREQTK